MGEVFAGRYELLDPIAMGGMGTVWCILDRQDGQMKAAKILRQSDAASLLRFVREQSMRIDHLHVVTPQSWAGMDDRVLFTMPLMRGGSVSGLLKRYGALPLPWVGALTDQMLQALEAVHAAEIVHRDVKPANLLLEPTGSGRPHLRLTDFGIAAPLDEPRMTRASVVIGSPGYMAPEQWRGADPDFRSDLYSVARVSLEMLTGERPTTDSAGVDLTALRSGDERWEGLLDLLTMACDEDPTRRPATATEMRQRLTGLGLESLQPAPDQPAIFIADEFSDVALPSTAAMVTDGDAALSPRVSPATHTSPGTSIPAGDVETRVQPSTSVLSGHTTPSPSSDRSDASMTGGIALIAIGMLALVMAGLIWFL